MKFQFTEKKVSLPESVHAYAEKKVMKLERFFRDDAEALVTFSVEKDRNKAEITVHAAGTYFRASEATSAMYASMLRSPRSSARSARTRPAWPAACGRMPSSVSRMSRPSRRSPKKIPLRSSAQSGSP